jgi:integrase
MNDLELLKSELNTALPGLGKHRIEELRRVIDRHYQKRFRGKRRIPKYGSLNKGFTDNQLQVFFRAINNEKHRLLFSYQAQLGLRIGEVVKLNLKDIDFKTRELRVFTEKAHTLDTLIIPLTLFNETNTYIECFRNEIALNQGYIFFRDQSKSHRVEPYLEPNYIRKVFRYYVSEAMLDEDAYGTSEEDKGRAIRQLHRLTTHSLRHYAITKFAKACNGNLVLTSRFARHSEPTMTMTYINTQKEELYSIIERSFSIQNSAKSIAGGD